MKPTAVLLTVILVMAEILFVGGSCITEDKTEAVIPVSNIISPEVSSKEEKALPASQPVYKQEAAPTAAKLELVSTYIKTIVEEGPGTDCFVMPPPIEQEDSINTIEDDIDGLMMCNLETEAEYPGGTAAWHRFLNKNMRYPEDSIDEEMEFSVVVKFAIDKEGNVCDVEAVSGPEALGAEAVRVIKQSGKWTPARRIKSGRYVKSFKKQPITVCVQVEE